MSDSSKSSSSGIGFGGALTILFIGLRLGGLIDWSWWWVLSPLWIPLAVVALVIVLAAAVLRVTLLWELHTARKAKARAEKLVSERKAEVV